jgi:RecJ-like exonuclease
MGLPLVKASVKEVTGGFESDEKGFFTTIRGSRTEFVRVMGRAMDIFRSPEKGFGSLVLDDETGVISAKFFRESLAELDKVSIGDLVEVSGRVNMYMESVELVCESAGVLSDVNLELLRKLETAFPKNEKEEKLLAFIKAKKEAGLEELTETFGEDAVDLVEELMDKGEIYEFSPKKWTAVQ